jgi:hypothetical protein
MTNIIYIITEGATEREVGNVLYNNGKGVLNPAGKPKLPEWRTTVGSREGYEQVIQTMREKRIIETLRSSPTFERLLLMFDQESDPLPADRADKIGRELGLSFHLVEGFSNLFENDDPSKRRVVLHVSDASIEGLPSCDFDGYILRLLQGSHKLEIAQRLASDGSNAAELLRKAEDEITEMMKKNGYPWRRAKSWLYAYITVFQFRQSHVWFAAEVVRCTPEEELRRVFASLIDAWDRLAR